MINPIFTDDDDPKASKKDAGYLMPNRHGRKIKPLHDDIQPETHVKLPHMPGVNTSQATTSSAAAHQPKGHNPAVDLIRRKLETMYADEPQAEQEEAIAQAEKPKQRSKHEQFMYELSTSGKSLAQIQTEWHNYYLSLPDDEKHQVWQEFYAHNNHQPAVVASNQQATVPQQPVKAVVATPVQPVTPSVPVANTVQPGQPQQTFATATFPANPIMGGQPGRVDPLDAATNMVVVAEQPGAELHEEAPDRKAKATHKAKAAKQKTKAALKRQIEKRVNMSTAAQTKAVQHAKSLAFGIGSGLLVLLVVLFGLFNEMVIAPFIQPSSKVGATPIILSQDGIAPSSTPEVIIPKINVQIPTDYSLTGNTEEEVQKGLEGGIVHYPTTVRPGQKGNAAYFGHSSNNIFNPGKYKFAFVKLHELVPGDIFYLTYEGKVYSYKVFDKQIVSPDQVSVLNNVEGKTATATLITCDPPGTALNRLVVWGEQISPDPNSAVDAQPSQTGNVGTGDKTQLTGNGPSLWSRIVNWVTGNEGQ